MVVSVSVLFWPLFYSSIKGVVLAFVIADEALFVAPLRRIGLSGLVELVGPDQLPFGSRQRCGCQEKQ